MLEQLFGSKTRVRLLKLFFRESARAFFVRELTRELGTQINAVRREITVLLKTTLIKETTPPGQVDMAAAGARLRKYYMLNTDSILYSEMQALLVKSQVLGQEELIGDLKRSAGELELLVLTGRFAQDLDAQVDILIVGSLKPRTIAKLISTYEKQFGFEIRYTTMTPAEYKERKQMMDKFLYSIFESKHAVVLDELE